MSGPPRAGVPLAPRTTLGLGGEARYFWSVSSADEASEALRWARATRQPVQVLGGGSNTIFPDEGFPGLVLHVAVPGLRFDGGGEEVLVDAGAGESWDDLVRESVERGLTGIECLSGIPGTVGAAPIQNVGAYGQELSETLVHVECLDRETMERKRIPGEECGFAYRWSRFKGEDRDRFLILAVRLRLARRSRPVVRYDQLEGEVERRGGLDGLENADAVRLVRESVLALRRKKSMVVREEDPDSCSAGSFFLNPVLSEEEVRELERSWASAGGREPIPSYPAEGGRKVPAAWLVEKAGFEKGYRHDGVGLSRSHALALVNRNGSTAELLELADEIREAVAGLFGVRLEREPVLAEPDGSPPAGPSGSGEETGGPGAVGRGAAGGRARGVSESEPTEEAS